MSTASSPAPSAELVASAADPDPGAGAGGLFTLRTATPDDGAVIAALVRELAEYEREPAAATATADDFARALGEGTGIGCVLAEVEQDGVVEVAGMALWYTTFSTWLGRQGMWLEDLYVRPVHRRRGIGRAFFAALAGICADRGFGRLEFWVLDWNTPAHTFYRSVGASAEDEWTVWRLDGGRLDALAGTRSQQ